MFLEMIRRRLWRERNFMAVLALAISMVTGFLALAPLYVQLIASSEFDARLPNFNLDDFKVEAQSDVPIEINDIVDETFGDWATEVKISAISAQSYPLQQQPGVYPSDAQIRVATYRDFDQLFTLVEGRFPEPTDDPTVIETVMTRSNWEKLRALNPSRATTELGLREVIIDDTVVEVVGIVETFYPDTDLYWERREDMLASLAPGAGPSEMDVLFFNVITPEAIFLDEVASLVPVLHFWEVQLDPARIRADNLPEIEDLIMSFREAVIQEYPLALVRADLDTIITDFYSNIRETERPIILLSALIIAVMLYNIVNISTMIMDQQHVEWAVIRSRGGSSAQLIGIHAMSMLLLGVIGVIIGPLLAWLMMVVLANVGPQAAILETPQLSDLPPNSLLLSVIAGVLAVLIVTLPAFSLARKDLLALKRSSSRPPVIPVWARFYVDVMMIVIGGAFLWRLYSLVAGEDTNPLDLLFDPAALTGEVDLSDPFNLIGPALLIAGGALLWMRIFPLMVRGINFLIQRLQNLSANLALWNVERDPGQYAQLVLLMIGTLAIGTASLSLSYTRDSGAWETARQITGNDVQIDFAPEQMNHDTDWSTLPDVTVGMPLVKIELDGIIGDRSVFLIGIDLEQAQQFPLIQAAIAPLLNAETPDLPGYELPEDTLQLSVDVLVTSAEEIEQTTTEVFFEFRDPRGIKLTLPGQADDNTLTDEFMTYTVDIPEPLTFTGLQFRLARDELNAFDAVMHLDNLVATDASGEQTLITGFESADGWARSAASERALNVLNVNTSSGFVSEGENSLRVLQDYNLTRPELPTIEYLATEEAPMPAIISADFATAFGQRLRLGRALEVGDTSASEFRVFRTSENYRVNYRVAGVVSEFPTMPEDGIYIITLIDPLLVQVNADKRPANAFDLNTAWLNLNDRQPSDALKAAVQALPGYLDADYAWDVYSQIQREPLPNAITGILFAGFWVSLALILINFAFYQALSARQRASSFAVLQAIGWERNRLWRMLSVENITFITPALVIGVLLGVLIAYLILPFMALIGGQVLKIPADDVAGLLLVLVGCFSLLLSITVIRLQRIKPHEALRVIE